LEVLGFPCNQFKSQEPADEATIKEFVTTKFACTFPMFSKVEVNGPNAHPVYKFLKSSDTFGAVATEDGDILWNFGKFLVGKDGQVVQSYIPKEDFSVIEADIAALLS